MDVKEEHSMRSIDHKTQQEDKIWLLTTNGFKQRQDCRNASERGDIKKIMEIMSFYVYGPENADVSGNVVCPHVFETLRSCAVDGAIRGGHDELVLKLLNWTNEFAEVFPLVNPSESQQRHFDVSSVFWSCPGKINNDTMTTIAHFCIKIKGQESFETMLKNRLGHLENTKDSKGNDVPQDILKERGEQACRLRRSMCFLF